MLDPRWLRKDLVSCLIDLVSQAISHHRLDDAETLLLCLRELRPGLGELETFEAWIAMRRGHWADAIRRLRQVDAKAANWQLGKALMAFCQFASGDPAWSVSAHEVLHDPVDPAAVGLMRLLLRPHEVFGPSAQDLDQGSAAAPCSLPTVPKDYVRV